MNKGLALISGVGLGAGLMYMLDPDRGRRRRALVRDKVSHAINQTETAYQTTKRDVRNRALGLVAGAKALVRREEVSDIRLVERVRSKIGRVVSHPHSIEIAVNEGRVTLSGPILADEVETLVKAVSSLPGVTGLENQLDQHQEAGDVPGLQGGKARPGERLEFMQSNWSPTARLLAGAAGGALLLYCAKRRDALGATAGTLGVGLLARGVTNTEMKRLVGNRG